MSIKSYLVDAFYSLGRDINKRRGDTNEETAEGVVSVRLPELTLDMSDDELVKLSDAWEKAWNESEVKSKWEKSGDENEKYWKGEHYDRPELDKSRSIIDNAIFEGLETYLPQVTRRNPEPMVSLATGEVQDGEVGAANFKYVQALQAELGELADELKLRLKLKGAARHWSVRLVGALKYGWDLDNDRPSIKVVRPPKLILDPNATVDEDGYTGERVGEHKSLPAWRLIDIIEATDKKDKPENKKALLDYIENELAHGELATEIGFIEWWTPDYLFWKCNKKVLLKRKNPHWNYDQEAPKNTEITADNGAQVEADNRSAEDATAVEGSDQPVTPKEGPAVPQLPTAEDQSISNAEGVKGVNYFKTRRMPYTFLSVYNLGKQPVDITSLIGQNLANQDMINKRNKQIDKNADTANSGLVVSLARAGLTKDQASGITKSLRKGGVVAIPDGLPQEAVWKPPMQELPGYVYNQLVDMRNRVRDIWGTRGSSPAGLETDTTVRGKIMSKTLDTDRIGGGINEYLEQMADDAYNWLIQLLYVYDDRFVTQIAQGTKIPKVKVSVKEGSLLPKDSTTLANQAIELSSGGKMSTIDLYKRLDYPNPEELAANVWLETNAPEILYAKDPRVQQVIQQRQQAAQAAAGGEKKGPSESINFKDLPPEGKAQMAKQAGIDLHPEAIAAHETMKESQSNPPQPELSAVAQ